MDFATAASQRRIKYLVIFVWNKSLYFSEIDNITFIFISDQSWNKIIIQYGTFFSIMQTTFCDAAVANSTFMLQRHKKIYKHYRYRD